MRRCGPSFISPLSAGGTLHALGLLFCREAGHCNFTGLTLRFFANLAAPVPPTSMQMAHKWTKASRAKLSRSQKARWRKRKQQRQRKRKR